MNLPNYFLADLPADAELTPRLIAEACHTLKHNRAKFLAPRSTASLITLLAKVAARWLEDNDTFRQLALTEGPKVLGFSRETLARGLDDFFRALTPENLNALLVQDLGHADCLDRPVAMGAGQGACRKAMAVGPEFLTHITAGNLPNPALMSIILGLLTRSAQFVKCATGTALLPRLLAHSIYEADPKQGACLEVAEWRGGNAALEDALFAETSCVTATGSDGTLASIRKSLPEDARFLGYGHRVSLGLVARGALARFAMDELASRIATDVVAWDQLGCLSPHVIYVEDGAGLAADALAELLATELARREQTEPRGVVSTKVAATIASRRAFYAVRAAHSGDTRVWQSPASTAWTVVYEADARFQPSCGHRWLYIKAVPGLAHLFRGADAVHGKVSTVGLAAPEDRAEGIVAELARWGVTRVCPPGEMQRPPLTWRHDGRPALGDLVTWTDYESSP